MRKLAWMLLSSANLSKAAWGAEVGNQLRVRSFELGVLFVKKEAVPVYDSVRDEGVIVPYSLPPRPYTKTDKPWIVDVVYSEMDTHGNKWPIPDDTVV